MHEVSIAQSILEAVQRESAAHGIRSVSNVHIAVGALAGVSIDSLLFAWDLVTEGSIAAGAKLAVREIPARACCRPCNHNFETSGFFALCPRCGEPAGEIVQGRELDLTSIEGDTGEGDPNVDESES